MHWMLLPLRRYTDFSGRSRRKEFWLYSLLISMIGAVLLGLGFVFAGTSSGRDLIANISRGSGLVGFVPFVLFYLAVLIPSIAVQVRRFHDRDMSGWWVLGFSILSNIPILGFLISIAWLVLLCLPGTYGDNRFGPDPKNPVLDIDQVFS